MATPAIAAGQPGISDAELDAMCEEREAEDFLTDLDDDVEGGDAESDETPPDAAQVEHNKKLAAQVKDADTWALGGRIGAAASGLMIIGGIAMLATNGVRKQKYREFATSLARDPEGPLPSPGPPPTTGLAAGGGILLGFGLIGGGASVWAMLRGSKRMRLANEGELALNVSRRYAGLTLRGRF